MEISGKTIQSGTKLSPMEVDILEEEGWLQYYGYQSFEELNIKNGELLIIDASDDRFLVVTYIGVDSNGFDGVCQYGDKLISIQPDDMQRISKVY